MLRQIALIVCVIVCVLVSGSVRAEDASSNTGGEVASQPAVPQADQPAQEEVMTDIIDIKPLEKIGYDKRVIRYILIAVAVLAVIGLIVFLIDYFMKKRRRKEEEAAAPEPVEVVALRLLDALEGESSSDSREFYFRLSAIMRQYIGGRYSIDALEMTNEELIPALVAIDLEQVLKSGVKELLVASAPVKFAGMSADNHMMGRHLGFVRELVQKTTPIDEPETSD